MSAPWSQGDGPGWGEVRLKGREGLITRSGQGNCSERGPCLSPGLGWDEQEIILAMLSKLRGPGWPQGSALSRQPLPEPSLSQLSCLCREPCGSPASVPPSPCCAAGSTPWLFSSGTQADSRGATASRPLVQPPH